MEKRMTSGEIAKKTGVYKSLELQENAKVLDLGCGYRKLWRNNWSEIPEGVTVDGYDLRGSWADDFLNYVEQNKGTLAEDTKVNLYFEDVEAESTWESIGQKESYNCIIAQYLLEFIKDREVFLERIANVLASGGMCSVNGANVSREHGFWQEIFEKLQLETVFLIEREAKSIRKREGFLAFLYGCFYKVETVYLESWMRYTDAAEVFAYLLERYPEERKCLTEKEAVLKEFFTSEIKEKGAFFLPKSMDFQHCFK